MTTSIAEPVANPSHSDLKQRWQALREAQPNLRIRNAANQLGVSELALVLLREDDNVQALKPAFPSLLEAMDSVGEVMILSRNDAVVHEVTGTFKEFRTAGSGTMGLALGAIDVRVFFGQWHHGFRVREEVRSGLRESLQFFDAHGQAIQKIYRTDATDTEAWNALVSDFLADKPTEPLDLLPARKPLERVDPGTIDGESLRQDWASLKDVHHFNALLKRHKVDRLTALELIGPTYATRLGSAGTVGSSPLDLLFEQVRESQCSLMIFVGNPGIVQIYSGPIQKVVPTGEWLNILDPKFNLHVNIPSITDWWCARRPSTDGIVTSLEGYNATGELALTVFGERKPGQVENEGWREECRKLERALCP